MSRDGDATTKSGKSTANEDQDDAGPPVAKTFAGGIGCAAIIAALIYAKHRTTDRPVGTK